MTGTAPLDEALRRMAAAVEQVATAAERRAAADAARGDLEDELAVMQDDRARLATELDAATAQARRLESARHEVSRRLARMGETLRALMQEATNRPT